MAIRSNTIDVAKGIGIILVVLGHNWIVYHEEWLTEIIFSFHMPLFFFLSGIFIKRSMGMGEFLRSRTNSLLKPFFVVLVILGGIKLVAGNLVPGVEPLPCVKYSVGILYGTGSTLAWGPMWFLPHLFISLTFSFMVLRFLPSERVYEAYLIAGILLLSGIMFMDLFWRQGEVRIGLFEISRKQGLPWSIDILPITSSFVIVGCQLGQYVQTMKFNIWGLIISLNSFAILYSYSGACMDLNGRTYGAGINSTLLAACGIYICFSVSSLLQKSKLFQYMFSYVGSRTLYVLIFSTFFQDKAFLLLSKFVRAPYLVGVVSLISGVVFSLVLWEAAHWNWFRGGNREESREIECMMCAKR